MKNIYSRVTNQKGGVHSHNINSMLLVIISEAWEEDIIQHMLKIMGSGINLMTAVCDQPAKNKLKDLGHICYFTNVLTA